MAEARDIVANFCPGVIGVPFGWVVRTFQDHVPGFEEISRLDLKRAVKMIQVLYYPKIVITESPFDSFRPSCSVWISGVKVAERKGDDLGHLVSFVMQDAKGDKYCRGR